MIESREQPFELSQRTRLSVNVAGLFALVVFTWKITVILLGIQAQLVALRSELTTAAGERWRADDMERWSYAFERANREMGIHVPSPRDPTIRVRLEGGR